VAIEKTETGAILFTGTDVEVFRLMTIRMGLKAERMGMRLTAKAPSCRSIVKKEFGIKDRDINTVIAKFDAILLEAGLIEG
jgi:hypothetical protein